METLLKNGADVNAKDRDDNAPLHCLGHPSVKTVQLLLDHNADVNSSSDIAETPLVHAIRENFDNEVFELLVKKGADVCANCYGFTALLWAVITCNFDKIELLAFRLGANVNEADYLFFIYVYGQTYYSENFNKFLLKYMPI